MQTRWRQARMGGRSLPRYPDARFLRGVGHGPNRVSCESDARGALSKVFSAQISQESNDWQQHFSRVNALGTVQVEAMNVTQLTRVCTDYVLKGSRVVEVWRGPRPTTASACSTGSPRGACWATKSIVSTSRSPPRFAKETRPPTPLPGFCSTSVPWSCTRNARRSTPSCESSAQREPARRPPTAGISWWPSSHGAKARAKVGLRLTGRDANKMQACLAEQLAQKGITVLEDTSDIDLMVHGNVKWHWAGRVLGSYMIKIDVTLRITDVEGGRTLAAFNEGLKTGRPQKSMALQSASNKLCMTAAPKLAEKIETALSSR